jgi:AraC-like DNA-binding protein
MKRPQTIEQFYEAHGILHEAIGMFNVFQSEGYCDEPMIYNRRDFYKIALLLGKSRLHWHHQVLEIHRPALVFYNPLTPFGWEPLSREQPGFFCLFKKEFIKEPYPNELMQHSPLMQLRKSPVCFLNEEAVASASELFRRMLKEIVSAYPYKYELLRHYLYLLIHEGLKNTQDDNILREPSAAERITSRFLELLERQFPIESPGRTLKLRTASDYAQALSIHVNHLNHAVKEVSGKTTSEHIAERIITEAKALLRYTNWTVSEIAYSLGFEYPNYFHNYYKKKTGESPSRSRSALL